VGTSAKNHSKGATGFRKERKRLVGGGEVKEEQEKLGIQEDAPINR